MREPTSRRAWRGHRAAALVLFASASFFACSLLAPGDDYFLGNGPRGATAGGEGSVAGGGAAGDLGLAGRPAGGDETSVGGGMGDGGVGDGGVGDGGVGDGGEAAEGCGEDGVADGGRCVSLSGCSDGSREAFLPLDAWPTIAGCTAKWPRASMRAPKTGLPCGYELAACAVPADACGDGWHVCASPPYGPTEISEQATAEECAAQPGAYVAAVGDQFCEPCSEVGDGAACCGERCVQQHGSCVYPGQTAWFGMYEGYKNVCGAIESNLVQRGVLCCRDR